MRIALDAMGGDHAPGEVVRGALLAVRNQPDVEVVLVGQEPKIRAVLQDEAATASRVSVLHAEQVVDMGDSPVDALKKKPDNSVIKAVGLVKSGQADAVVTAGHTGAAVAAATLTLGTLEGVRRPGICVCLPTQAGVAVLLDVGANIKCRPIHLVHYGIMGSAYARAILGVNDPRVGLLNIGEEAGKGTDLIKETHRLFDESKLNFRGNAEGQDIFRGTHDVYVTEGFAGNLILKVSEGLSASLLATLKRELVRLMGQSSGDFSEVLRRIEDRVDYAEYGGALLLGVNGVVIIAHGRSESRAIANAVRQAAEFVRRDVNETIRKEVRRLASQIEKKPEPGDKA